MSSQPDANELLKVLCNSREHAKFLGELGVETVELTVVRESPAPAPVVSDVSVTTVSGKTTPTSNKILSPSLREEMRPIPQRPKVVQGLAPQDSLFGDLAPAQPSFAQAKETLEDVWRDIGDCTRCGLCEGRTQVVNTHGNPNARLMFVGEAPGADEDAQGKPFVGRAGQLLTKMIEAMGMKREEVIIGNVNRCRPPGNRQPTLEEAAICRPFLFREISAVRPEVIVVMGNTALRNLLEVREGITRVRGKFQDFRGIKVMPTFHPAYLLRDPSKKRETWEDLKKVIEYLDHNSQK
jgi:uracil-DNA glycosylase family 4